MSYSERGEMDPTQSVEMYPPLPDRPLDPELIEEDFVLATDIMRRFAAGRSEFSLRELRQHLITCDVLLPETHADTRGLVTEMRHAVVRHYAERGTEVRWLTEGRGTALKFMLARVERPKPGVEQFTMPVQKYVQEASGPAPRSREEMPTPPLGRARGQAKKLVDPESSDAAQVMGILALSENGRVRASELRQALAVLGVKDPNTAIKQALKSGGVHKSPEKGILFYSTEPAAQRAVVPRQQAEASPVERPLTDAEVGIAIKVMDTLTAPGTHVQQGQTIKMIEKQLGREISGRELRKLLRALEEIRLIKISSDANYGQARKSPKVTVRGQDMKDRWRANRDGYVAKIRKILL